MTIKEAEDQYYREMENYENEMAKKKKQVIIICSLICGLFLIAGIVLTIIGFNTPPEILTGGFEWEPASAIFEKVCGIGLMVFTPFIVLISFMFFRVSVTKGKLKYLSQIISNLYSNYIRSEDIKAEDVEFYKQKLEDNRHRYSLPDPSEVILIGKLRE